MQAVEQMLRDAASRLDEAARLEQLADLEQHILDEALALPLYWTTPTAGYRLQPWVHGFNVPKYGGSIFADVWFDDTAPARELPMPWR